jgi:hypothetical protein
VRLSHAAGKTHVVFDDERLISCAGLVPVMRLAERCGLGDLVTEHVRVGDRCGANAAAKVSSVVAGMAAGADSIDDLDVLRHGGMTRVFDGIRAPSTLGSFLRCLRWGNAPPVGEGRAGTAGAVGRAHTAAARRGDVGVPGRGPDAAAGILGPQAGRRVRSHQDPRAQCAGLWPEHPGRDVVHPLAAPVITATQLRGGTTCRRTGRCA